jgi:hypothetical protein
MLAWTHGGTWLASPYILAAVGGVGAAHILTPKDSNWSLDIPNRSLSLRAVSYASVLFILVSFGATDATPFIYFQF